MADQRIHKSVSQRLDIELRRQPNRLLRRRRVLTAVCAIWPIAGIALFAALDDRTIYWARPVSDAHRLFQNDCAVCHQQKWQAVYRLALVDTDARSVRDQDCRRCHRQQADDHHAGSSVSSGRACVHCHREHRGAVSLSEVADSCCTDCHADLAGSRSGAGSFFARVASFEVHPEFAVRRRWPARPASSDPLLPGREHGIRQRAELEATEEGWTWRDSAALRFNHKVHMQPLLLPWDHPEQNADGLGRKQLDCGSCHQQQPNGQYMQPVNYERHCAECHPLKFAQRLSQGGPLPHDDPQIVLGTLRNRLLDYARSHPQEVLDSDATALPRMPGKRPAPSPRDEFEWVESEMDQAEDLVFRATRNGCMHCHQFSNPNSVTSLIQPEIPDRWMPHSRFDHRRHQALRCVVCHAPNYSEPGQSAAGLQSVVSQDILMPSIEVCRKCHGQLAGRSRRGQAGSDCVLCHDYHHLAPGTPDRDPRFRRLDLDELLTAPHD